MEGWIKLHRKIIESPVFGNPKLLKVWIYCLAKATHKDRDVVIGKKVVHLKSGEFIFGRLKAAEELEMNDRTVYDYIKLLEEMEMISISSNNKFSVISLANWGIYQDSEENFQHQSTIKSTIKSTIENDTNKNVKNVNNVKNIAFRQLMVGGTDYDGLIGEMITINCEDGDGE